MRGDVVFMEELPGSHAPPLSKSVERMIVVAVALLLLVPCFWQPYILAGDLASHSYNAWLAGEIRAGRAPGLTVEPVYTNVLTDLWLERLIRAYGRSGAEPVVVALAVETFFWGAFLFIGGIHRAKPWMMAPSLAMLAYGLVFHFGFLNFYLSTGLSLWIMWLLWRLSRLRVAVALPLVALAFLAHPVPLAWAAGCLIYFHISVRVPPAQRPMLLVTGVSVLVLVQSVLTTLFPSLWSFDQIFSLEGITGLTGTEQVWIYGAKYLWVAGGLFVVWGRLFLHRLDQGQVWQDPVVQLWLLNAAAFALMPKAIQFTSNMYALLYVPQRISLLIAILFCAVVGGGSHGKKFTSASLVLAGIFFVAMYLDQMALNGTQRQVAALLQTIPPRQRVVVALKDAGSPLNGLVHIGSGACIGRCYDYANYEPATAQFRIRVNGENRVVAHTMNIVRDLEEGRHVVTATEAPIYSVCAEPGQQVVLVLRRHAAGEKTCVSKIRSTLQFGTP